MIHIRIFTFLTIAGVVVAGGSAFLWYCHHVKYNQAEESGKEKENLSNAEINLNVPRTINLLTHKKI